MTDTAQLAEQTPTTYYVDEAGDGVLFGPRGRERLLDPDASKFFMLGMVRCASDENTAYQLNNLRASLRTNPLYATIYSLKPEAQKTARAFHAKDDPSGSAYGSYHTRKGSPPDPEKIKSRWI
jgi:hypothetical protein